MKFEEQEFLTKSPQETKKLAYDIIKEFGQFRTFALMGDLGSGKTTFVQGVLENLGFKNIISPTFLIIKEYQFKNLPLANNSFQFIERIYHIDCYRIDNAIETELLGIKEILADKSGLVFIEWAEKIGKLLPPETVFINFSHQGKDKRKIKIKRLYPKSSRNIPYIK